MQSILKFYSVFAVLLRFSSHGNVITLKNSYLYPFYESDSFGFYPTLGSSVQLWTRRLDVVFFIQSGMQWEPRFRGTDTAVWIFPYFWGNIAP